MTLFAIRTLLLTVLCVICQQTAGSTVVTTEGCLYVNNGTFKLHCEDHEIIDIILYANLGRSVTQCWNNRTCCPSTSVCNSSAPAEVISQIQSSCYGMQECQITLTKGQCNVSSKGYDIDYESVAYICSNNSLAVTTSQTATTTAIMTTGAANGQVRHIGDSKTDTAKKQANVALIAGLTTAACVVVIAAVLVVLVYRRRRRRPANQAALNNQLIQPKISLNKTSDSEQSEPGENPYDTIPEDTVTHPPDDTLVYYNSGHTVAPSDGEYVYYNEQSGARGAKKRQNLQISRDVPLDELYSKPNKQRKPENDSQDIYAEVKRKKKADTDQRVDSRETPGDSDIMMVENELYN